jgi:hypothetical protein
MLRRLYRCAVRLHPPGFRRRFGDEMLYIFDQQKGTRAGVSVTLDCFFSLLRQWTLRSHTADLGSAALSGPTADYIPSFGTIDAFRPRASAIINGTALSLILFCLTVFAIRYSWIHVLNLRTRENTVLPGLQVQSQANPSRSADASSQPFARKSKQSSDRVEFDLIPSEPEGVQVKIDRPGAPPPHASSVGARGAATWLRLDLYTGRYIASSPPARISIRIEGDHLSLAIAGHPHVALSPVSRTRFVIVGAQSGYVEFTGDDQGGICCLSLVEGGNVITAKRQ